MRDLLLYPACPQGMLTAPPSKSAAHRALICASLAHGSSQVSPLSSSQDMRATCQVLSAMGVQIQQSGSVAILQGGNFSQGPVTLSCGESGSTLRFLLPVAAALGLNATFCGEGRLPERPIGVLAQQLAAHGISFSGDQMPFTITGKLTGGQFSLPGNVSSQFVSGLLFALPLVETDSEIILTSPLQSAGYVDMTRIALAQAGITIEATENGFRIPGGQFYRAGNKTVESDFSNAAFWLCAGAIGGDITVCELDTESAQGDRAILEIIRQFGGDISITGGQIRSKHALLTGCRVDASPIPDLVPIIAVMAAFAHGNSEIYNAARLRIKESDRLATVTSLLRGLGGTVEEYEDRLIIHGGGLQGGNAQGANDHRIVMSAAIAALFCKEPVSLYGAQAVEKSYPDFFDHLTKLGGHFHVVHMG